MKTRYTFFQNQALFDFDPSDPACLDAADYSRNAPDETDQLPVYQVLGGPLAYYGHVFHNLHHLIGNLGLHIIVSTWPGQTLPFYGPHVVLFILQDEWSRSLRFLDRIGMVFRTLGRCPFNRHSYGYGSATEKIANGFAQVKAFSKGGMQRATKAFSIFQQKHAPVYDIPLGCYAYADVKYIPIAERSNDLYFSGSVQHKGHVVLPRPKELARKRMSEAVLTTVMHHGNIKVMVNYTSSFAESVVHQNERYLEAMMDSKICLIPRGSNLETFRFYEAIRYGCIPMGEAFPDNEFYNAAPIVRLQDWSQLPSVIPELLNNPEKLANMHQMSLAWWRSVCSEEAAAAWIFSKINQHFFHAGEPCSYVLP